MTIWRQLGGKSAEFTSRAEADRLYAFAPRLRSILKEYSITAVINSLGLSNCGNAGADSLTRVLRSEPSQRQHSAQSCAHNLAERGSCSSGDTFCAFAAGVAVPSCGVRAAAGGDADEDEEEDGSESSSNTIVSACEPDAAKCCGCEDRCCDS